MARFVLPQILAGLSQRIGHDDAVHNAQVELDLVEERIDVADDLIRRVERRTRRPESPAHRAA